MILNFLKLIHKHWIGNCRKLWRNGGKL